MTRPYPDEAAGGFPKPPRETTDDEGRTIAVCHATDLEALVNLYVEFDPADRAQGIPPLGESSIREWLERITVADAVNLAAQHNGRVVGHAMLVGDDEHELAIFVLQAYQNAGIGTELLRTTLGAAAEEGIKRVWLAVERWNDPAIALYRSVGFEAVNNPDFEMVMTLKLDPED